MIDQKETLVRIIETCEKLYEINRENRKYCKQQIKKYRKEYQELTGDKYVRWKNQLSG